MSSVAFAVTPLVAKLDKTLTGSDVVKKKPAILSVVLKAVADAILDFIIARWPVATAKSIAGWGVRRGSGSWEVFNPVDYVSHVHDGLAESLFDQALGRAPAAANAMLKSSIQKAKGRKVGTRSRAKVTPSMMGRAKSTVARTVVRDKVVIRQTLAKVSTLGLKGPTLVAVRAHVSAGRVQAAVALLVQQGMRSAAQKLARSLPS